MAKHHATWAQVGIPRHLSEVEEPQMGSKGIPCSSPFIHSPETYLCGEWLRRPATGIVDNALGEPTLTAVRKHLSWHFSRAPFRIHVYEPHDRDCRSCSQVRNFCTTWYKDAQWQWLQRESFQIGEWSFSHQTKFDRSVSSIYKSSR